MNVLFQLITLIYLSVSIKSNGIEIVDSGVSKINRNDMVLRFYVTVHHHGRKARNIFINVVECCENVSDDDVDCESLRLYEEYIRLPPGIKRNLTLIHPSLYLYNRKGSCLLDIWHHIENEEGEPSKIRHRLRFDTTVKYPYESPTLLRGFYNPKFIPECETRDLDPFNDCTPVNCYIKYSGLKNYFNERSKVCQKVPACVGNPKKELADIVYVPYSNTCRDLEKFVTDEDIMDIVNGKAQLQDKYTQGELESSSITIQCHHGKRDPKTGVCICDYGWKSAPLSLDGDSVVYQMCNVKCRRRNDQVPLVPFLIGIILSVWILLCICFCEKHRFARQFMTRVIPSSDDCACTHYVVDEKSHQK